MSQPTEPAEPPVPLEAQPSQPLQVSVQSAQLRARGIDLGHVLIVEEVQFDAAAITFASDHGGVVRIGHAAATLVLTEAALNRFLADRAEDSLRDLSVAMMTGKLRVSGRYGLVMGLSLPFTITGVPEIDGGARLRLDPKQMSLVGAPLPGVGVQIIGERINARLARALDITRLPWPIRLTSVTVEPGRVLLSAEASLELRAPDRG